MCNKLVSVRKVSCMPCHIHVACMSHVCHMLQGEGGELYLEGAVCEDYYKVRQLLYDQFAII